MVQEFLLRLYRHAVDIGLLRSRIGRAGFDWAYRHYKQLYEARHSDRLALFVKPGATVIDVGANTGFFTTKFRTWAGPQGLVIAIEPEAENLDRLRERVAELSAGARVEIVAAVASDRDGSALLCVNPYHPGDHKIAQSGVPVASVTLDGLMRSAVSGPVSFIKIDVQGAELDVIKGAAEIIARDRPTLFVEVSAAPEEENSPASLLRLLSAHGYTFHLLDRSGPTAPMTVDQALALFRAGATYVDFLCLAQNGK